MSKTPTPPPPHTLCRFQRIAGSWTESCLTHVGGIAGSQCTVAEYDSERRQTALEAEVERLKTDNKDLGKEVTIWRQLHPEQTATVLLAIPLRVGGEAALARDRETGGT